MHRRTARQDTGAALVLLAAGRGTRVGHETNKVLLPLAGRRVLTWSLTWAREVASVVDVVLVCRADETETVRAVLDREAPGVPVRLVTGGETRHESEQAAFASLRTRIEDGTVDVVVVHDAARPLAGPGLLHEVIEVAREVGGAVPVLHEAGMVPLHDQASLETGMVTVQTPQAFRAAEALAAYDLAAMVEFEGSDTASCIETFGSLVVHGVQGSSSNMKITFPEDLFLAERLLARHRWRLA